MHFSDNGVTFSQWFKLKKTWTLIILLFIAFTLAALATAAFFCKEKITKEHGKLTRARQ